MNCSEAQNLLSAYYDGELSDELRNRVLEHVRECSDCRQQLRAFEQLTEMASAISIPTAPDDLWEEIEARLAQMSSAKPFSQRRAIRFSGIFSQWWRIPLVTLVVLAIGIGSYLLHINYLEHPDHFPAEFEQYLKEFPHDPVTAQKYLLTKYQSRQVVPAMVASLVGYPTVVSGGMPPGLTVESTFVIKMPCCTCVQTVCRRADGSKLAVFEHMDEPQFFGDRSSIKVNCDGQNCQLVELDNSTAVSWKREKRFITLIGINSLSEVDKIVSWINRKAEQ